MNPRALCPRNLFREEYDAFQADMWNLGVALYAMLMVMLPFRGRLQSNYRTTSWLAATWCHGPAARP